MKKLLAIVSMLAAPLLSGCKAAEAANQLMLSCDGTNTYDFASLNQPRKTESERGKSLVIDLDRHTMLWGGASRTIPLTEVTETRITGKSTNTDDFYFSEHTATVDRITGAVSTFTIYKYRQTGQWGYTVSGNLICHVVKDRLF
jgi:hypothetical protein